MISVDIRVKTKKAEGWPIFSLRVLTRIFPVMACQLKQMGRILINFVLNRIIPSLSPPPREAI